MSPTKPSPLSLPPEQTVAADEYKFRVLGRWTPSAAVEWVAQIVTTPDGQEYATLVQYATVGGKAVKTAQGLSFPYTGASAAESVEGLTRLLSLLCGGRVRAGQTVVVKVPAKDQLQPEQWEGKTLGFVYQDKAGFWYRNIGASEFVPGPSLNVCRSLIRRTCRMDKRPVLWGLHKDGKWLADWRTAGAKTQTKTTSDHTQALAFFSKGQANSLNLMSWTPRKLQGT